MTEYTDNYGRVVGTVRWYRSDKKYGFIKDENKPEESPRDVFFHICEFKPNVTPQPGQAVQYRVIYTDRGPKAVDCVLLPTDKSEVDLSARNQQRETLENTPYEHGNECADSHVNGSGQ